MAELIFWGALFIVLVIAESLTVQLVSIWFAVGSAVSFITAMLGGSLLLQIIVFTVVSVLLLVFTRPFLKKVMAKPQPTNADSVIGKSGIVIHEIENLQEQGRIKVDGLTWNARSVDGTPLEIGAAVSIVRIEGVTAFVEAE